MKNIMVIILILSIILAVVDVDNMLIFFATKIIAMILFIPAYLIINE